MHLGQINDAIETYQMCLIIDPGLVDAHCNLGNLFKAQGRIAAARQCYLEAIRLNPTFAIAWSNLAGIFKEVLTVACSAIFLGDHLTLWNVGGLGLCIIGIGMYNRIRLLESAEEEVDDDSRHSDAFDSASLRHVQPVDR